MNCRCNNFFRNRVSRLLCSQTEVGNKSKLKNSAAAISRPPDLLVRRSFDTVKRTNLRAVGSCVDMTYDAFALLF